MYMQCMAGASLCVGSASGMRAWLARRDWSWLTAKVIKRATVALMAAAAVASSLLVSSVTPPTQPSPTSAAKTSARTQGADWHAARVFARFARPPQAAATSNHPMATSEGSERR